MMSHQQSFRCPVCRARFRSTRECSRCGADLSVLMTLVLRAQACRERAREALHSQDVEKALSLAREAQFLYATESGRRLLLLSAWLQGCS